MKKAGNLFVTAYLLWMMVVYPFFLKQGYADIDEAKYQFFINGSMGALVVLAVIGSVMGIQRIARWHKEKSAYLINWEKVSVTDLFVLLYATAVYFSYIFSDYRQEALWGTKGWYIGLVPLLVLCALYYFISRMWDGKSWIWLVAVGVSGIVFLLGILDSFSLYILPLENRQSGFISTLGNINWFCGYLSVLAPIGAGILVLTKRPMLRWFAGISTFLAFMAGFCQGSNSVFLFFGALFFFYLWVAVQKREWLAHWFLLLSLFGFSSQIVRFLRVVLPGYYNYDTENLCGALTSSGGLLLVGIGGLCAYLLLWRQKEGTPFSESFEKRIHRGMVFLLVIFFLGWLVIGMIHTQTGISALNGSAAFTFDAHWGNGRGAAYAAGLCMFGEMSWLHRLLGVGPDCFASYAYSLPELAAQLRDWFGASRLTNAHNELLTTLVNTGIMGTVFYVGIFVSFVIRCTKKGKNRTFLYITAACVCCYFTHNMVSFAQVLNLPFVFLILGMGECIYKNEERKTI